MRAKIKVACGATKGRGHEVSHQPCQDKTFTHVSSNKNALISLADGAGSCSNSHFGAEFVVSHLKKILPYDKAFSDASLDSLRDIIVTGLQNGLAEISAKKEVELKELSSTLMFVYAQVKKKKTEYLAGHIGDGLIATYENKQCRILSHPEGGEFASSTFFITSNYAHKYLRLYRGTLIGNTGFLIMSDGVSESLYNKKMKQLAPACSTIFKWGDKYKSKKISKTIELNLSKVFKQATRDDCSIGLLRTCGVERT